MTRPTINKHKSIAELGDAVPGPLGFNAFGPECCVECGFTIGILGRRVGLRRDATRAPGRGPEWRAAASILRPPQLTNTPGQSAQNSRKEHLNRSRTPSISVSSCIGMKLGFSIILGLENALQQRVTRGAIPRVLWSLNRVLL